VLDLHIHEDHLSPAHGWDAGSLKAGQHEAWRTSREPEQFIAQAPSEPLEATHTHTHTVFQFLHCFIRWMFSSTSLKQQATLLSVYFIALYLFASVDFHDSTWL